VHGGIAQGIAQALYEEAVYDSEATWVTGTMVDYLVPSAADLPHFPTDRTSPRRPRTRLRQGVGEAGTIASTPRGRQLHRRCAQTDGRGRRTMPCSAAECLARDPAASRTGRTEARHDPAPTSTTFGRILARVLLCACADAVRDANSGGGQSVVPLLRLRLAYPSTLSTSVGSPTAGRRDDGDAIVIGAMTTHHNRHARRAGLDSGLIAEATGTVADPAVSHRGTSVGHWRRGPGR